MAIDLSTLNREALITIITQMSKGASYETAVEGILPDTILQGASWLHTFFCKKNHSNDECLFYKEGPEDVWSQPVHKEYAALSLSLFAGETRDDILVTLDDVTKILKVIELSGPQRALILKLLNKYLELNHSQ